MYMNMIENLRQRPEEERLAFAALAAGLVGLILFLLWGATFFTTHTRTDTSSQAATALSAAQTTQELQSAMQDFSGQYAQLKSALQEAQFTDKAQTGTPVVDISVDTSGEVQAQNVIVGPVRNN